MKTLIIVTRVDDRTLTVRMTWVGERSDFKKGKPYPVVVGREAKHLEKVALLPIFEGYQANKTA